MEQVAATPHRLGKRQECRCKVCRCKHSTHHLLTAALRISTAYRRYCCGYLHTVVFKATSRLIEWQHNCSQLQSHCHCQLGSHCHAHLGSLCPQRRCHVQLGSHINNLGSATTPWVLHVHERKVAPSLRVLSVNVSVVCCL